MKQEQRQDFLENKKNLDFLIKTTEMLHSSNAIVGRNDEMFVVDINKLPNSIKGEKADLDKLFMGIQLTLDHDGSWGGMNVVTGVFTSNNLLFCEIASSLSSLKSENDEHYPCHDEVRNWFLNIPPFSKKDKDIYENIYKQTSAEISEFMQEHTEELFEAIFSPSGDQKDKKKLH